jgi:cytochrome P450
MADDAATRIPDPPAHVPPELVMEYDHVLGPNTLDDPFAPTQEVLDRYPPVFYAPSQSAALGFSGTWVVSRYDDIREVLQNTQLYSSKGIFPFQYLVGETFRVLPAAADPPEHDIYRTLLNPWFSPKEVTELERQIHAAVGGLIDGFVAAGECDAAYDFSRIYPVKVFMSLMGFPAERFEDFLKWGLAILHHMDELESVRWGARSALAYLREFVAEARDAPPNAGLTSRVVHSKIEGRPITDEEIIGIMFFLWIAGLDTVAAASTFIFRWLALHPDLQAQLRADPSLIPEAIEEFLRMHPTVNSARAAKADHEIRGVKIKEGDRISCFVAAGNFDPEEFEDPRIFRLDRPQNRHLTFVAGPHRCIGSHLARREMKIALTEFLRRIPPFRLKEGADRTVTPGLIATPHLPLVWDR